MVGRPEGLVFALLSALMLVLVAMANLSAPTNVTIGMIGLVPILACAWFLSHRFTVALVGIAIALRLVVYLITDGDRLAVLAQITGVCMAALVGHLAAVAVVRWWQSEVRVNTLSARTAQATELERAKSEFLRLASHELRGPVAVLQGYLSMLADGSLGQLPEDARSVIPMLTNRVGEINRLIEHMLETARLEDSRLELKREDVVLARLIEESMDNVRHLASEQHRLVFDEPPSPVLVNADRVRLGAIVGNLVSNAIKYSPNGGEIRVRVRPADGHARVEVEDQGLGIHPDDMAHLFTRFGRIVRPETADIPGTGLGLYLSRELARLHGGDLTVRSQPGRGSTFTLSVPVAKPAAQEVRSGHEAASAKEAGGRPEIAR